MRGTRKKLSSTGRRTGLRGSRPRLGLAMRVLGREHEATVAQIVTLMSTHPARLLGRRDLGSLAVGAGGGYCGVRSGGGVDVCGAGERVAIEEYAV